MVPEGLRTVYLGGAESVESAEEHMRKATVAFAAAIRRAEDGAEVARGARRPLSAADRLRYWPSNTRPG